MSFTLAVPAPIQIEGPDGTPAWSSQTDPTPEPPWTMYRWLCVFVLTDKKMGKGTKAIKATSRLKKALKGVKEGTVEIDEADRELVLEVIKDPTSPAWENNFLASQFLDFILAWEKEPAE